MLSSEARVHTERPARYLDQLCRHVQKASEAQPEMQAQVEWSEDRGLITFGWGGRCTLRADQGVLSVRAEAPDEESLLLIQQRVADRLERFGRLDHLAVTWASAQGSSEPPTGQAPGQHIGGHAHG